MKKLLLAFLLLLFAPIGASAARYFWASDAHGNWQTADRSSAGLLPPAGAHQEAVVRVFAARTVRWRGIFAVHTWIVVKERGARTYSRYDYTAWGEPIRTNGFSPDGRWFGAMPETIVAVDGERAEAIIPKIRYVIENYKFRSYGDYSPWPGPNSNTFVQAALDSVPELRAVLPPTAIGKDFPYNGRWIGLTPSGTGVYASLAGYLGLTVGWVEGFEFNFFGAVLGFDIRRPAIKLPGLGRLGVTAALEAARSADLRSTKIEQPLPWDGLVQTIAGSGTAGPEQSKKFSLQSRQRHPSRKPPRAHRRTPSLGPAAICADAAQQGTP